MQRYIFVECYGSMLTQVGYKYDNGLIRRLSALVRSYFQKNLSWLLVIKFHFKQHQVIFLL